MGAEHSKKKNYENLTPNELGKVDSIFAGKSKLNRQNFVEIFENLPFASILFEKLQHGEEVEKNALLVVLNYVFSDLNDAAQGLLDVFDNSEKTVRTLVSSYCASLKLSKADSDKLEEYFLAENHHEDKELAKFLLEAPLFVKMYQELFARAIGRKVDRILPKLDATSFLLSTVDVAVLNDQLAMEQKRKWTLLFSSTKDGSSFSRLSKLVNGEGPCIVVIESTSGRIFGMHASEGFTAGPLYHGNEFCFIFEISPRLRTFMATGKTKNYAYLNYQQQSLPNGMGIGGTDDVWPLFLKEEYGTGTCHETSTAFEKSFIAGEHEFQIKDIEVWRTGDKPVHRDEDGQIIEHKEKSIIDKDPEALAVLEMSGKQMYSEAYRDPAPLLDDDEEE